MVDAADFVPLRTFGPKQVEEVHSLYLNEWWANRRTLDETRRVVANSTMNFGIVRRSTGELVSYARVLSDLTFKAVIFASSSGRTTADTDWARRSWTTSSRSPGSPR